MNRADTAFTSGDLNTGYPGFGWMYESDGFCGQSSKESLMKWLQEDYLTPRLGVDSIVGNNYNGPSACYMSSWTYEGGKSSVSPSELTPSLSFACGEYGRQNLWQMGQQGVPGFTETIYSSFDVDYVHLNRDTLLSPASLVSENSDGSAQGLKAQFLVEPSCPPPSRGVEETHTTKAIDSPAERAEDSSIPTIPVEAQTPTKAGSSFMAPAQTGVAEKTKGGKSSQIKSCPICSKKLRRDLTRHMRIHEAIAEFACPFPRVKCPHKHGQFNRPYEYKKHLMNCHFNFDDSLAAKNASNLSEKLKLSGICKCGIRFENVEGWITGHVRQKLCPLINERG